jgi:hypothetical protein
LAPRSESRAPERSRIGDLVSLRCTCFVPDTHQCVFACRSEIGFFSPDRNGENSVPPSRRAEIEHALTLAWATARRGLVQRAVVLDRFVCRQVVPSLEESSARDGIVQPQPLGELRPIGRVRAEQVPLIDVPYSWFLGWLQLPSRSVGRFGRTYCAPASHRRE